MKQYLFHFILDVAEMWLICEVFVLLFKVLVCTLEGMFRAVFPAPKKDISGQIVLITGTSVTCVMAFSLLMRIVTSS